MGGGGVKLSCDCMLVPGAASYLPPAPCRGGAGGQVQGQLLEAGCRCPGRSRPPHQLQLTSHHEVGPRHRHAPRSGLRQAGGIHRSLEMLLNDVQTQDKN